jgi:hypothetical protein
VAQSESLTTVSNSITFNSDGSIFSLDGTELNRAVRPATAMSDGQKAGLNIQTRVGTYASYNTGSDQQATQRSPTVQVQMLQPTGLVKVAGYEVTPEVAETLTKAAPSLTEDPSIKAAEAARAADAAREDEAKGEDLGRHQDDNLESYHQHLVGEVSQQNLIGLMVYGQKNETPPADLLKTIAQEMGEPLGSAIDKVNAVIGGVHRQFNNLATAAGVDPEKAAVWIREHRKDTAMVVSQAHLMRRDVRGSLPLLEDYRMATGDGRKH